MAQWPPNAPRGDNRREDASNGDSLREEPKARDEKRQVRAGSLSPPQCSGLQPAAGTFLRLAQLFRPQNRQQEMVPAEQASTEQRRPSDERHPDQQARSSPSTPDELPGVVTVPELAAFLRISEKSVYALVSGRRIAHMKVLRCVRFLKSDVLRYVQENRVSASEE